MEVLLQLPLLDDALVLGVLHVLARRLEIVEENRDTDLEEDPVDQDLSRAGNGRRLILRAALRCSGRANVCIEAEQYIPVV